jgi:hypothetical protein
MKTNKYAWVIEKFVINAGTVSRRFSTVLAVCTDKRAAKRFLKEVIENEGLCELSGPDGFKSLVEYFDNPKIEFSYSFPLHWGFSDENVNYTLFFMATRVNIHDNIRKD